MLRIIIQIDAPERNAQAVKEDIAMYLERWGDTRVVSVEREKLVEMEQMRIPDNRK